MTDELPDQVVVAFVHGVDIPFSFFDSHRRLVAYDLANNQRLIRAGEMNVRYGTGGIVAARNKAVVEFLKSDTPWLLWIDSDMGFAPDSVDRLVEAADPVERPVIGGLCFASREVEPDGMGGFHTFPVPTVYDWHVNPDGTCGFLPRRDYERDVVTEVSGTGSAFILIHRTVFEKIAESEGPGHWYDPLTIIETGAELSEDLAFCTRVTKAGYPIYIHTGVRTTHYKPVWLGELHYQLYRKALGPDSVLELRAVGYRPDDVMPAAVVEEAAPENRAERRRRRKERAA